MSKSETKKLVKEMQPLENPNILLKIWNSIAKLELQMKIVEKQLKNGKKK